MVKSIRYFLIFDLFLVMNFSGFLFAKEVTYDIDIDYKTVNYTGKDVQALSIGGGIPGPTIEATLGDTLRVTFNNKMDEETSIHWHGVLLPNDQDGVPHLTTKPIPPHSSFTYEYPIIHSGTYWYHSHTGLQEQKGMYGSLVFHPKEEIKEYDHEFVLVFSDWTDENPHRVLSNLKRDGDYYALKKDAVQSWWRVLSKGSQGIKNRLRGSWTRMGPMDLSDVGYDLFLVNGQKKIDFSQVKKGQKVKLRMINAAASSYFFVQFSGSPITVIAADGVDVAPIQVPKLRMAIAETYDVIISLPNEKSYELRASSEDGTGFSSAFFGKGEAVHAPMLMKPDLILMNHENHGSGHEMAMQGMDMSGHEHHHGEMMQNREMMEYDRLRSLTPTTLPENRPWREIPLRATGFMERFAWSFDGKPLSEADKILIRKGENVRFILKNETMMHHPIHLHGHFFRVLNGRGEYAPLKHTVNLPPMDSLTIEFQADEEKDWFFHCHNLYHMAAGMARVVGYDRTSQFNKNLLSKIEHDTIWYHLADVGFQSNMVNGRVQTSNTRNTFELEFDHNYDDQYEVEALYERRLTRFLGIYGGGKFEKEKENENSGIFGIHYMLPMLIEADLRVNTDGNLRFGLGSSLQLTSRLNLGWSWNTNDEYRFTLAYEVTKQLVLIANYDSNYQGGAGIEMRF
ncbi:multicopper oxidase domain-containing protein [Simkania negevensis]|uniref:Multicopper oxidase domain-containing protein n=1 Tax=Simkania negevensis TaxID=83561 RepID=A0ABS3ASU3_9BACT|nr:multicopper oxidase domain-containing protein [Simkania negevensis]